MTTDTWKDEKYLYRVKREWVHVHKCVLAWERIQTGEYLERGKSRSKDKEKEGCSVYVCMKNSKSRVSFSWFSHLVEEQTVIYSWKAFEVTAH